MSHALRPEPEEEKAIMYCLLCWIVILTAVVGYLMFRS